MADLVEQLRDLNEELPDLLRLEAADEIERLKAEVRKWMVHCDNLLGVE